MGSAKFHEWLEAEEAAEREEALRLAPWASWAGDNPLDDPGFLAWVERQEQEWLRQNPEHCDEAA